MRAALILLLSAKMCTFVHSYLRYVVNKKVTIRAEYQARYSALILVKIIADSKAFGGKGLGLRRP